MQKVCFERYSPIAQYCRIILVLQLVSHLLSREEDLSIPTQCRCSENSDVASFKYDRLNKLQKGVSTNNYQLLLVCSSLTVTPELFTSWALQEPEFHEMILESSLQKGSDTVLSRFACPTKPHLYQYHYNPSTVHQYSAWIIEHQYSTLNHITKRRNVSIERLNDMPSLIRAHYCSIRVHTVLYELNAKRAIKVQTLESPKSRPRACVQSN